MAFKKSLAMSAVIIKDFGLIINPMTKQPSMIQRITLSNNNNMTVKLLTLGANISSLQLPDKNGNVDELALSFDSVQDYVNYKSAYIGSIVGRVANRVANGRFTLNGKQIRVTKNIKDKFQLHGGFIGFDSVIWEIEKTLEDGVIFKHVSPDGHEGYPGEVTCLTTCTLNDNNEFRYQMEATTNQTTCVNMTNHVYFNLAGHNTGKEGFLQHVVTINSDHIVDTDSDQIPTGEFHPVDGSLFDLRCPVKMAERLPLFEYCDIKGFDDCYCVKVEDGKTTNVARVEHPESGRWLEIHTNQPGVQFYTSNNLPDVANGAEPIEGKCGASYVRHCAFCLETQKYPDSMNHEKFPSIFVNAGEKYYHDVVYKFGN